MASASARIDARLNAFLDALPEDPGTADLREYVLARRSR
jgi:hypothetical protein